MQSKNTTNVSLVANHIKNVYGENIIFYLDTSMATLEW